MSYPVAAGTPSYVGTMIPEIWSGLLQVKFYANTVLTDISNTDYEGEIKGQGDTVHIRTIPTLTISDHVKGQKWTYETPEPDVIDLLIDKGKRWAFVSDDVTKAQADYNYVESWTGDAAKQLVRNIETAVYAAVYADAHADNIGTTAGAISGAIDLGTTGTPFQLTKANIVDKIVEAGQVLDEQNVPTEGRWMIIPAWARTLVMGSDLKNAAITGDAQSIVRKGMLGMIDKFTVYSSNLLSHTTDTGHDAFRILFGHKSAITFATQLTLNEGPMRTPDYAGDFYRGLQVFGFKVVKPEGLGVLYAYK